jgi:hypothetical protein
MASWNGKFSSREKEPNARGTIFTAESLDFPYPHLDRGTHHG